LVTGTGFASDFVTINTPLTAETLGWWARGVRPGKPTAFFINTARGPIVQQEALTGLRERRGAGIDVFSANPFARRRCYNLTT
jgi:phosphoglycerate dehydrogenase-like enzyme